MENIHKFTQYTHFLFITKTVDRTIHSWQAFNSLVCPLMLRTNNRCVESINISVMSLNEENIHKFTQYTDYLSITKKVVMTEQSIHGNVSTHKDVLLYEE